jgi:hypothetical protein
LTEPKPFPPEIDRFIRADALRPTVTFDQIFRKVLARFGPAAPSYDEIATFICRAFPGRPQLARFRRDPVMTAWAVANMDTGTIAQIRRRCVALFGRDRTPSHTGLQVYLKALGRVPWRKARPSRRVSTASPISRRTWRHSGDASMVPPIAAAIDPAIDIWIRQVAPHMTISALRAALVRRFRGMHMPSRSQLHRYLQRQGIATAGRPASLDANPELGQWLHDAARTNTLDQLRRAALERFGASAIPSRSVIHRFLQRRLSSGRKPRPGWPADIATWIKERQTSLTLDDLHAGCVSVFGADRAPSRSAIHRFVQRARW